MSDGKFSSTLSQRDLRVLREVVVRVHMNYFPKEHQTHYEIDKLIDSLAPDVVERMIRFGVDHGDTA